MCHSVNVFVFEKCVDNSFDFGCRGGYYRFRERDIKFLIRNLFVTLFDFVKSIHGNSGSPLVGSFKVNSLVPAKRVERLSLLCCKVVLLSEKTTEAISCLVRSR